MLRRPEGATVDEVARATGWQRHTVCGVFSGTLTKKLGLTLASAKEERGRVYASPSRQAHETSNQRRFGSPARWEAVTSARSTGCLAPVASHWTASRAQSRSADPSPCQSAARTKL